MKQNKHLLFKRISLVAFCCFYIIAGINHFLHPKFYLELIPPYLPDHKLLNIISGICEIAVGVLMIFPFTRRISAYGTIGMLTAFIPAHVYMIQQNGCVSEHMCIAGWIAWVRLPFQFILMWWAWKTYKWNG